MQIETEQQAVEIGIEARALADAEFEKSGVEISACEAVQLVLEKRRTRTQTTSRPAAGSASVRDPALSIQAMTARLKKDYEKHGHWC